MKQLFYRFLKKCRQLFDFRQPRFRHLQCIDLILENKPLLLLSWDIIHAGKIRVRPGRTVYRQSSGAAICSLPFGTDSVDISLHNVWRSTRTSFTLKRVAIDQQTFQYLSEHFPPPELAACITHIQPTLSALNIELNQPQPELPLQSIAPVFNISINQPQFNDYAP